MMVTIWNKHFDEYVDAKGRAITPSNTDEMPQPIDIVQPYLDYNDDDYDPFGDVMLCDLAGNDLPPIEQPTTTQTTNNHDDVPHDAPNVETYEVSYCPLTLAEHYPAYGWTSNLDDCNNEFRLNTIEHPDLHALRDIRYRMPKCEDKAKPTARVPFEIWYPLDGLAPQPEMDYQT